MSYSEWLEVIDILKNKNDQLLIEKIQKEEINKNINSMLVPKLLELIKYKFTKSTSNIIKNIEEIFTDNNMLDLILVKFKKDLKIVEELTYLKQINIDIQNDIRNSLKLETIKIYDLLLKEANNIDNIGLLSITIKNNMFKWSDNDEL